MRSASDGDATGPSGKTLHRGLPYGGVMATAGASLLAGRCGLPVVVVPLLVVALAQALWVPVTGLWRRRAEFRTGWSAWLAIGPPRQHAGMHTVPLGLAVITSALAGLGTGAATPWTLALAQTCLGLAWVSTLACVTRFLWSLARCGWETRRLDGTWFLVPAAWLGAGIAADAVAQAATGRAAAVLVAWALAGTLLGWFGYWVVAVAALVRVWRFGLGDAPRAPWWIAMGCAGLAAAALGRAAQDRAPGLSVSAFLATAMTVTVAFAIILCIPVLVGSVLFLLRHCRFRAAASWPPTFSTAVFALGCLVTGEVLPWSAVGMLGLGAAYATLLFWTVTATWNAGRACISGFGLRNRQT